MIKPKYLYDIFDVIEKDYVIINAKCIEVTEIIGMTHEYISSYSKTGRVYDGRYIVTRKNIEDGIKVAEVKEDIPQYLWDEFERLIADIKSKASPERLKRITLKRSYEAVGRIAV